MNKEREMKYRIELDLPAGIEFKSIMEIFAPHTPPIVSYEYHSDEGIVRIQAEFTNRQNAIWVLQDYFDDGQPVESLIIEM
jgi:hypothetical protein